MFDSETDDKLGLNFAEKRLFICKQCPLYQKSMFGDKCNGKLYLNPNTNHLSTTEREGFFQGCGCIIEMKVNNINNKCSCGKW